MSRHRTTRLLVAVPVLVGLACAPPPQQRWRVLQQEPTVRVGLLVKGVDASLELSGDFELRVADEEPQLLRSGSLRLATLQGSVTLWTEEGREYSGSSLSLRPRLRESRFRLGDHWYRGDLRMTSQDGRLTLINALPLETGSDVTKNVAGTPNWRSTVMARRLFA